MLFDFSEYTLYRLNPDQGVKPLDIGGECNLIASINADGRFIAVNGYHTREGMVTLTSVAPFPDADRYDAQKVRAYRQSLVTDEGFGVAFEQQIVQREAYLIEGAVPFLRFTLSDDNIIECLTIADKTHIRQIWRCKHPLTVTLTGDVRLMRAAYTQLTEGGVLPMPAPDAVPVESDKTKKVDCLLFSESLNHYGYLHGIQNTWHSINGGIQLNGRITIEHELKLAIGLQAHETSLTHLTTSTLEKLLRSFQKYAPETDNLVLKRASVYSDFCHVHTEAYVCSILTDHMILPLSWNRDAYYVASVLTETTHGERHMKAYNDWLRYRAWRGTFCQTHYRPVKNGWARSYLANGMPKDNRAYQLDQQLFPILQLIDSHNMHELSTDTELRQDIHAMLHSLLRFHPQQILLTTDETPADDEIPLPYHFSSHILLWHIYNKLADVPADDALKAYVVDALPPLHDTIRSVFTTDYNGQPIFSYAASLEDDYYLYHDANDIPLVMMPLWGFCDKDDPVWRNTVNFAFSEANPGFFDGVLGSVHTPAPWSLGDAQELILCKVIGDRERYQRVWQRVEKTAQWDGALPEAYNAQTGEVVSRHWFAWPNAMIAIADSISWEWEQTNDA
jgi:hypothetical protein